MGDNTRKLEVYVGLFVIVGIILVMGMVLTMSGGVSLLDNTYKVVVDIDNIGDLRKDAPVKMGGVVIGRVDSISILNDRIQVVASIDNKIDLRTDSHAQIATSGLVGDSFLDISRGKSGAVLQKVTTIAQAPHIEGVSQPGMGELLLQVQSIGDEVKVLVANMNQIVGKKEVRDDIMVSIRNVREATERAKVLLGDLDKQMADVDVAVKNIVSITQSAQDVVHTVQGFTDQTIGNAETVAEINQTIRNVEEITTVMAQNRQEVVETLRNVRTLTDRIVTATEGIGPGSGVLRLFTDDQAGAELMQTLANLQTAANSLAKIGLSDLIADKNIGDAISKEWMERHRNLSPDKLAIEWKKWMSYQKRVNGLILGEKMPGQR